MNYQFIVISASEERKQKMIEIFKKIDISDDLIYFLEASTPQNSEEYFIDSSIIENNKKFLCCAKSHFRSIEYAAKDESPEYSIILEDDVAVHKTDFLNIIEEIILNWTQYFNHCHYISLGWIPCNNYNHYKSKPKQKQNLTIKSKTNINDDFCFFSDFYNVGLQCYMVKKCKIISISTMLNQKTYNIFIDKFKCYMKYYYNEEELNHISHQAVDCILNRIMNFEVIFPPLVIEQKDTISLLGHNNYNIYWSNFLEGHEDKIKNYITY